MANKNQNQKLTLSIGLADAVNWYVTIWNIMDILVGVCRIFVL